MTHMKVFFWKSLLKVTFERKLSDMTYPVAQVFTFKSLSFANRLSSILWFRLWWAVIGQSEVHDIVDKQHGEVESEEMVRWRGFYVDWSAEILWMLYDVMDTSYKNKMNKKKPSPIIRHFNSQCPCFSFQACHVAFAKVTCAGDFSKKPSDVW